MNPGNARDPRLPLTLRPSPRKWLAVGLASAVLGGGSVLVLRDPTLGPAWEAWIGLVFFGLGVLISALQLIPGVSELRLERAGFTVRSMGRTHVTAWKDVAEFGVLAHSQARKAMVGWNYRPGRGQASRLRKLNAQLLGYEAGLPDTYGMDSGELVALLETLRQRHGG